MAEKKHGKSSHSTRKKRESNPKADGEQKGLGDKQDWTTQHANASSVPEVPVEETKPGVSEATHRVQDTGRSPDWTGAGAGTDSARGRLPAESATWVPDKAPDSTPPLDYAFLDGLFRGFRFPARVEAVACRLFATPPVRRSGRNPAAELHDLIVQSGQSLFQDLDELTQVVRERLAWERSHPAKQGG